jgi:hypothetical protein
MRRPLNPLSEQQHATLARSLAQLQVYASGKKNLRSLIRDISETLEGWMALETGSQEYAEKTYSSIPRGYQPFRCLAPVQEADVRRRIDDALTTIEIGYEDCSPRSQLLGKLRKVATMFDRWLLRTAEHWRNTNHKLLMDSPGLVAVDVKEEPFFESSSHWREARVLGTSKEANVLETIHPHLFEAWREEDEAEGVVFDPANPDTEHSLLDHMENLTFYRYVGPAQNRKQVMAEVSKAFFFEPMHIWFKQRLIN